MALHHCVYILFSAKDHLLYIGYSSNIELRLQKHNEGGVKSTAGRRPLMLIFTEHYLLKEDALKREGYFKTSPGKKALKLMLGSTLERLGYKKPGSPEILFEENEDSMLYGKGPSKKFEGAFSLTHMPAQKPTGLLPLF